MKLPRITSKTIREIKRDQKINAEDKLEFAKLYQEWVKKNTQQNKITE